MATLADKRIINWPTMKRIVRLSDFDKVLLGLDGTMHLIYRHSNTTLCGLEWRYSNNRGMSYCRKCQQALAIKLFKENTGKENS